jgi:hypothetical protein
MVNLELDINIKNQLPNPVGSLFLDNNYSFSPENVMEHGVRAMKYVISSILPVSAKVYGFWVEFYEPKENRKSIYGHYSDDQGYGNLPDRKRRAVVTGMFIDRYFSGDNLDNYFGPPPQIFLVGDDSNIPENTKVRILLGKEKFVEFQVDVPEIVYGLDQALLTKLKLLPVSAQH